MSMQDDIIRLEEKVDEIGDHVCAMVPMVERADRELFGNGRPGLSVQMASIKARQKLALKVLGSLGAAGLVVLGGILLALLT